MSAHADSTHDPRHPKVGHLVPVPVLVATLLALLFLTWLTVAIRAIDLGPFNLVVAMLIATVKAALVIMFFMHMFWDRPFNIIAFVGSLAFVALFICFTLTDRFAYESELITPDDARYAPAIQRTAVGTAP